MDQHSTPSLALQGIRWASNTGRPTVQHMGVPYGRLHVLVLKQLQTQPLRRNRPYVIIPTKPGGVKRFLWDCPECVADGSSLS